MQNIFLILRNSNVYLKNFYLLKIRPTVRDNYFWWGSFLPFLFFLISVLYIQYFNDKEINNLFFLPKNIFIIGFIISLLALFFASFIAFQKKKISLLKFISLYFQSFLFLFFSYSYVISIDNEVFYLFASLFISIFLFIHCWCFLNNYRFNFYLILFEILIFSLQKFSWLVFLESNKLETLLFNQEIFRNIFNLPTFFWQFITSLSISLVTINSFKINSYKKYLKYLIFLCFIILQFLYIINIFSITLGYWQKTLLLIVVWDYLYKPLAREIKNILVKNFYSKFWFSTLYHFLILVIVYFS